MRMIQVGVVGTGFSASSHVEALRRLPGVVVAGVAGSSKEKSEAFAKELGIPSAYPDYRALVTDPKIQAVHNCTPNALHFEINKLALEQGKHLLSEKPLAMDPEQSGELVRLAERAQVQSAVCFNYRHYPMVAQAKELLRKGQGGKPIHVHGGYLQDWLLLDSDYSWRLDPEVNGVSRAIADIGSHWCDTVQYVLDKKIVAVCADLKTAHPVRRKPLVSAATFNPLQGGKTEKVDIESEDYGSVLVHFEDDVQGVFTVSQVSAGRKNRLFFEVAARQSAIAWDQELPNRLWVGKRGEASEIWVKDPEILAPRPAALAHYPGGHEEGWPDGLKNLCADFYGYMTDRRRRTTHATFADGHRIVELVDAILRSHRERRWIDL
ncbi:Gfo/Idh/MocA family oxidoreductase [Paenibacillus sp. IB182496]|uniref:Gfo/Idh/MocA family oxidoreductase n=1 Tax=Paenibacillus sabuli TaxID=2772509 RepID=A0A927BR34_9BACL|nr:Gfo/Idh/MocA family oxidoreductase [Paenibacillus sabuli]MBD2844205.1 Gfo/Idh/MocA family oxidoreductase [Paenibacillus sabuli]